MDIDHLKIAALVAAFFVNWRCLIAAVIWLADVGIYESTETGIQLSFWLIILYCLPSLLNIKFPYKVHQGFLLLAAVNFLALIDYTFFGYETTFYLCYPWLIHGIDCWIIWQFLSSGGNQDVGLFAKQLRRRAQDFIFSWSYRILLLPVTRNQKKAERAR